MKFVLSAVLASALAMPAVAAVPVRQDPDEPVSIGTAEVSVDVVVRDKDGRPVKDLTVADFQLSEDGTPQEITSFRLISRATGAPPDAGLTNVSAVAIVFDRLSLEGRDRARQAALTFISGGLNPSDLVGVFTVDTSIHVIQPFTNDVKLLRAAIESIGGKNTEVGTVSNSTQLERLYTRRDELSRNAGSSPTGPSATGGAGQAVGLNNSEQIATEMTIRSIERFDDIQRDAQGYEAIDGLLAIIAALARVPGRKAAVFFSEGISITSNVEYQFKSVIGNANRSNVSFYTVDAAGLRLDSVSGGAARDLSAAGNRRIEENATGLPGASGPMMRGMERNEAAMRRDPELGLRELATGTGGTLITGTNDPGKKLQAVNDDLRTHYALAYVPKNQSFDGKFREISVKVGRSNTEVQARRGYFAINATSDVTVLPSETAALAALHNGTAKTTFPVRMLPLSFPESNRLGFTQILVQAPMSEVTLGKGQKEDTFVTDFTILALVRGEDGRIVSKLSKRYEMSGPSAKAADFKKGDVLFSREATLPPGDYMVDAIVYDAASGKSSAAHGKLVVPKTDAAVRMSSVVIIDRAEKLPPAEVNMNSPLRFGDTLLYPNLGTALSKKAGQLAFFTTIYTQPNSKPKFVLRIAQQGKALAELPIDLTAADAAGRIQFANALPLDAFAPGTYELRLTVGEGAASATSATKFTVAP